ncbi:MAG: methylenetetrahydrofolate--tRNA-(uracil(54)-C(5))-methyltransferase (FADH(2)-oxidizing) TrmFO [Sandaracinaceae bacterium]
MDEVTIIGAGLAGCECAWQLAERGVSVRLIEQKPEKRTPAQSLDGFAELVCSNSFRGADLSNAVGLLKEELRRAGSLVMACGERARVPAGGAFAVDRVVFSAEVTARIEAHPKIAIERREVTGLPDARPLVVATGPLTSDALAEDLARTVGAEHLAYYDAIAPVIAADSIDWDKAFRASRYDKGGDAAYVNCPMTQAEYEAFIAAILAAEKVAAREFEEVRYFEGCLPIEVMAERGPLTLAYGPMKPVGLTDPRTGARPYAVVQLRQENKDATAYNLVGFQTRMKWPEQQRVFRMIPGLEGAEFERMGSVHRNTYLDSPRVLGPDFTLKARPGVYLAGQVSGVEGYVESCASGLVIGAMLAMGEPAIPPETTALGGLMRHVLDTEKTFAPSNVMWSMVPALPGRKIHKRRLRREKLAERALADLDAWLERTGAADVRARTYAEVA